MLPLQGVKVIEFCQVAAGPFCGLLLADMGADVVKVESPDGGDGLRQWPPHTRNAAQPDAPGYSENFAALNRNKRSVALDLKDPAQRESARRLALSAEVVVENFRPGVLPSLVWATRRLPARSPRSSIAPSRPSGRTAPGRRQSEKRKGVLSRNP